MNNPMWLKENSSMVVTVKDLSKHYQVPPQKIRKIIQSLGFKESKTSSKYMYTINSHFHRDKLNAIHNEIK